LSVNVGLIDNYLELYLSIITTRKISIIHR